MSISRLATAIVLLLAAAGCSSGDGHPNPADVETGAMQPLKARYPDVVMGFDPKGRSIDVSIDLNAMMSMDEDKEAQMKADALTMWQKAWKDSNPGRHGTLIVRIIDFRGDLEAKETAKV
jgi:hypothetical protein